MAGISWTVPIVNHQLHGGNFSQFVNVMDLRHFDMVLATLTHELCVRIIVFDQDGAEKMFPWM